MPRDHITYYGSNGLGFSQTTISRRLRETYGKMMEKYICEGCGSSAAVDHDHTISQKRCKELHMTELIWDEDNIVFSCRSCHMAWESYKSGEFAKHYNIEKRMIYMLQYDREGFIKRLIFIPEGEVQERLNLLI